MNKKKTSERLKQIMAEKGLKQIDILNKCKPLCKKWGIKEFGSNTLSQYVTGKVEPSQKALSVLAEALGVNEVWLMGYDVDYETIKTSVINITDTIVFSSDLFGIKKDSEVPVDIFIIYMLMIYTQKKISNNILKIIKNILDFEVISDKDKLSQISLEIEKSILNDRNDEIVEEVVKKIESVKNYKDDIKAIMYFSQRKELINEMYSSNKINKELYDAMLNSFEKINQKSIEKFNNKKITFSDDLKKFIEEYKPDENI